MTFWNRRGWEVLLCAGVLFGSSACSQTGSTWESTGSVSLQARTEVNGTAYRLRDGLFDVTGPQTALLSTEENPDAVSIDKKLAPGSYSVNLRSGFRLEKQFGTVFEPVAATLTSPNPRPFVIAAGQITPLDYAFQTNGVALPVGDLAVTISVADSSNPPPDPPDPPDPGALTMTVGLPMHHPPRPGQTATIFAADVGVFASASSGTAVQIANDVNVFEGVSTTTWAAVATSGTGGIQLNQGVDTGSIWAVGTVDFPPTATLVVHGSLRTTGGADEVAGQVSGQVFDPTSLDPQTTTVFATFPTLSGSDFSISSGTQTISPGSITNVFVNGGLLTINPGSYRDLVVNAGTVALLPGSYTFNSVTFNSPGVLQSNGANGFIRINVRESMLFRGLCTSSTGVPNGFGTANLRWAVFGAGGATLGPANTPTNVFRGTVVAMNGPLMLEGTRTYRGAFFGQSVNLHVNSTVQHIGFAGWETPTG